MACIAPCHKANVLAWLLCSDPTHVATAVEVLSGLAQESKNSLAEMILKAPDRGDYIGVLRELLSSPDSWLCSTAAYLFGALAESEAMVQELQCWAQRDGNDLIEALGQLLTKDHADTVMNAARAIASLVESAAGRKWLLRSEVVFGQVLASLSTLLDHERESTVNSAALILARLSLCEVACQSLIGHPSAARTFRRLAQCLAHSHTDTAMNAAVAVGHLCGSERGRSLILAETKEHQLVSSLQALLCEGAGPEAGQTACFALSCLATEEDGHALVLESPSFPSLLDGLLSLLQMEEQDSAWFAAMVVKVFVSRPAGVIRVRKHGLLEERLQSLFHSPSMGQELQEEVRACLRRLQRLPKPSPVTTRWLPSGACTVSWEKCTPESDLEVTYSLLDNDTVLYCGTECHMTIPLCVLQSGQALSLCLILSTSDGDASPCSEPVVIETERAGIKPGPPQELRVIGCTATLVRLCWVAPEGEPKPRMYHTYRGDTLLDTTPELEALVGGLSPGTLYRLSVCAVGPGDTVGPRAEVEVRTPEGQDHAPSGLTMVVLGRHELQVSWGAPAVPLGRLFNYELRLNGCVAYLGTERAHTARRLSANTAYTCTVAAITSRGRCESRPVTKRTARDEYLHTQRCLYSPSRQTPAQTTAAPPPVREVGEVREKVKKSPFPHGRLSKVHLTIQRQPSVPVQSHRESSKTSNQSSEMSVGLVNGYDMKSLWKSARKSAEVGVCRVNATDQHMLPVRAQAECNLLPQQSPPLDAINIRAKISTGMLLQWSASRGGPADRGRLPLINHRISEAVRLIQPISHNWPELDWTGHHQNRVLRDRIMTGSRLQSELRGGRHYLATNWTKLS